LFRSLNFAGWEIKNGETAGLKLPVIIPDIMILSPALVSLGTATAREAQGSASVPQVSASTPFEET
jgi:hypothetical protein